MRMCFFAMCALLLIRANALASAGEPLLAARRRVQLAAHVFLQSRSCTREMGESVTYPEVHVSDVMIQRNGCRLWIWLRRLPTGFAYHYYGAAKLLTMHNEKNAFEVQLISAKGRQLIRPRNGEPLGYGKVSHSVVAKRATQ
jgi:hypothetical protein